MSDSQRPKPAAAQFVIPDLELDQLPQSRAKSPSAPQHRTPQRGYSAPNLFDEDPFDGTGLSIEINQEPGHGKIEFGSSLNFDAPGGFELEPTATPLANANTDETSTWPSGRTPDAETLDIDPVEIALLANYGPSPASAYRTPAYAYRVFTRQRELKQRLLALCTERDSAEAERETVLAELAQAVRPAAQEIDAFRRFLAPLLEIEQQAAARGQALSSVNIELSAHSAALDAELAQLAEQARTQHGLEQAAAHVHAERELLLQRAEAKLKRVQIEIRAVTHVAEQKLGPQGGQIPEPEASQLTSLRQRAVGVEPEVGQAKAGLAQATRELEQLRTRLETLRQAERQNVRKKQVLGEHYQKELQARSASLTESEAKQRGALADLARAVLAARGSLPVDPAWLERARSAGARADLLIQRCEMQRRAVNAYDHGKVGQGVRLTCTALALIVLLVVLKIAL